MTFADSAEVANLMGNKTIYNTSGVEITSTVISDAISRSDSRVVLETGISSWSGADSVYGSVQQASEYFAVSYILSRYGKNENEINKEAMDYYQMALDICASLSESSTQSLYISSKSYKSYPINQTTGTIHRSLPSSGSSDSLSG